ncbi:type IV pilus twitching motility protein PilT [Desulfoplanes sp.]
MQTFTPLVERGIAEGVSDMHITGGHPVIFRKNGKILFVPKVVFSPEKIDQLVTGFLTPRHMSILQERFSVDLALTVAGTRLRINVFATSRGLSIAARFLPTQVPSLDGLNLHPALKKLCTPDSGLVLFCGPTGSGKSTTIAALINVINQTKPGHTITLEDPIEYLFRSRNSFIQQRELGEHFLSYRQGLLDILREDPDVIVVGELREPETIRLTLGAAESGHLVFGSLHASNPEEAVYRICNSFPLENQEFVRYQLASSLIGVVCQKLMVTPKARFRVPLLSMMFSSPAIRNTLRDNKIEQIENIMEMSREKDMFTFDRYEKEFLRTRRQFTPPWECFGTCTENSMEKEYVSPLLAQAPKRGGKGKAGMGQGYGEDSGMLDLEPSDQNVEEIISQIQSRGQQGGV